jgi:hypothetical protein
MHRHLQSIWGLFLTWKQHWAMRDTFFFDVLDEGIYWSYPTDIDAENDI